jgi:mannose-6-phosphate isomerase-like protein (cupin superfamily)
MADEQTEKLREMARHRGLKLKTSRRRKPGGDFGRFGLVDAADKPVLGIGAKGLEASAEEVEAYLRDAMRATWKSSAGSVGARKKIAPPPEPEPEPEPEPTPKPKPAPKPKPKPKFKVAVANLFAKLPAAKRAEAFTELLGRPGVRIERIVSNGQITPEDEPMVQEQDEWVVLLQGEAGIRIEDSVAVTLKPGDHLTIAGGQRHWVTYTAKGEPTVWLAVHIG